MRPCVLFGTSFPTWLPYLNTLGLHPVMVVLQDQSCLSLVEKVWFQIRVLFGLDPPGTP